MTPSIRPARAGDLPEMVALLVGDGEQRRAMDPALWPLAADAARRIESVVAAGLAGADPRARELWLLAEASGRIVGVTHAMIVPPPPIYGVATPPGLFLDDCFTADAAPPGTAEALIEATEAALHAAGAGDLIASCPAAGPWRPLYARRGYEPVTLYMARDELAAHAVPPAVRPAAADDVPGIVRLSADHRETLAALNPTFWQIHPDADGRFEMWMRYSLTLKDRDMFVAGAPGAMSGYIIAQPVSPPLIPAAHDIAAIGVIDDFYDRGFADVRAIADGGATAADLLAAAESALARRGFTATLAVCPAVWASKAALLEREGFKTAKLWMFKG